MVSSYSVTGVGSNFLTAAPALSSTVYPNVELTLQAPSESAQFSWSDSGSGFGSDELIGSLSTAIDQLLDFVGRPTARASSVSVTFLRVEWSGGVTDTIRIGFNARDANSNPFTYQFFFPLAGASIGDFQNSQEASEFLSLISTTRTHLQDPQFQPDTPIALTAIAWDSIVEIGVSETGDNDNNALIGTDGDDTLDGGRGDDTITGLGGDDDLKGGVGEDVINGGAGVDTLRGGIGQDTLNGGGGNDVLRGQKNADTLNGGQGDDNIKGGGGNDRINGGAGSDFLKGGTRADTVNGGDGNDKLFGNSFGDVLDGGAGSDTLNAGGDADTLNGGTGDDRVKGGAGRDTFVFSDEMGADRVLDFAAQEDLLQISGALTGGLMAADAVVDTFGDVIGGDVVLDFGGGNVITLDDLGTLDALTDDNIMVF